MALAVRSFSAGSRVRVIESGTVPHWSTWDDDKQRTSSSVKKRLQELFFKGDRKLQAQVVFIISEGERERLKRDGRVKVEIRDPAGASIVITADAANLRVA